MTETADVVIVGGGLEGAAAAWSLAQRGVRRVVVLERHTVASGGTGKSSGIVRCHYGVASLAAMAWAGVRFFEQAETILGTDIGFHPSGYVVGVGACDVDALTANVATQQALGVPVDLIDRAAGAEMWPVARLDDFAAFAYEPRGGYGDGYRTAQAFAAAARRAGVTVRQNSTVVALLGGDDGVRGVRLATGEEVHAAAVVVAAGPWSVALLRPLGLDLPVRAMREEVLMVDPGVPLPPMPVFSDLVSLQYVRPESAGEILFGNSDLSVPEWTDPDTYSNTVGAAGLERAVEKMADRFPGLPNASITSGYAGCYDITPDFNPVISRTDLDGLVVAAGFSGHGFKIAPAVGTLIADLVCDGRSSQPDIPESDFRLARFAEGALLRSPHPYLGAGQMR